MKYLLVFNPKAKRYSRASEARLVRQAARLLSGTVAVTYTTQRAEGLGRRYDIADFARHGHDSHCVIAVGGDGTVNIVISALARHGLLPHIPLGVIPYGTGNNLVRSFGLERDSEKALVTIRQGYTTRLDISLVNQEYYGVNVSFGLFPYLLARRVTNSLLGYMAFSPGRCASATRTLLDTRSPCQRSAILWAPCSTPRITGPSCAWPQTW